MLIALILYALLGVTFLIGQQALEIVGPVFFIGFRMSIAGTLLLSFLYFFRRKDFFFHKEDWLSFIKIILFHVYITFIAEFWGLQYLSAPKTALMFNLAPFITVILSYIILKQKITVKQFVGLLIAFFGFLPILLQQAPKELSSGSLFFLSKGEFAIFIAVATACYAWLTMQKLVSEKHYSPLMVNGIGMFFGGVLALITTPLFESWPAITSHNFGSLALWTGLLIIISNIVFYNGYAWLLKHNKASYMAAIGLTTPLFAAVWEWIFLGETMSWHFYLSLIIISIGLAVYYFEEARLEKLELSSS